MVKKGKRKLLESQASEYINGVKSRINTWRKKIKIYKVLKKSRKKRKAFGLGIQISNCMRIA